MKKFLLAGLLLPVLAQGADSVKGVAVGGIVLNNTDRLALKKQVLTISRAAVMSEYELVNESAIPLEETISFPLPEYSAARQGAGTYYGEPSQFSLTVDGEPAPVKTVLVAKLQDADVTAQLRKLGLTDAQIAYNPSFGVELAFNPLTPAQVQQLTAIKLWAKDATGVMGPAWTVQPTYVWKQKFPVKQLVTVQHVYRPFVTTDAASWTPDPDFTAKYCADRAFMGAWKRAKKRAGTDKLEGHHVHYLLKNGNVWKNGIEQFTLNISKLDSSELLTLCFPGNVRRPQAKTFQFRHYNFRPKQDLDIYFGNLGAVQVKPATGVMPTLAP